MSVVGPGKLKVIWKGEEKQLNPLAKWVWECEGVGMVQDKTRGQQDERGPIHRCKKLQEYSEHPEKLKRVAGVMR